MAAKKTESSTLLKKNKVKRKGIHAKKKASKSKSSKNYLKRYSGQGR
jgi:hypothetical protein